MDVGAIRTQLAAALDGLGYRTYASVPAAAQLPCAVAMWPDVVTYNRDLGGGTEVDITVTVAVSDNDPAASQAAIDLAMSTTTDGMAYRIQKHPADGAWRAATVTTAGNVRQLLVAGATALAADFTVSIIAP